jgi:hypothetical protein
LVPGTVSRIGTRYCFPNWYQVPFSNWYQVPFWYRFPNKSEFFLTLLLCVSASMREVLREMAPFGPFYPFFCVFIKNLKK